MFVYRLCGLLAHSNMYRMLAYLYFDVRCQVHLSSGHRHFATVWLVGVRYIFIHLYCGRVQHLALWRWSGTLWYTLVMVLYTT